MARVLHPEVPPKYAALEEEHSVEGGLHEVRSLMANAAIERSWKADVEYYPDYGTVCAMASAV